MKTTSISTNYSHRSLGRSALLLIPLLLACFALAPNAKAVCQNGCDTSNGNTFLGDDALVNNTTGSFNTANGANALEFNTTGDWNTAVGYHALDLNTTGSFNTAVGWGTMSFNVTGGGNTAVGVSALASNFSGGSNTAVGNNALLLNTTGNFNTATGTGALQNSRDASNNTAYGFDALQGDADGSNNTAVGYQALRINNHGDNNTALGWTALANNTTGNNNIALGYEAGLNRMSGNNNIDIFNRGVPQESNTIRIGSKQLHNATFIAGISAATVPTGIAVIVDTNGHLGTTTSSARFKDAIEPMNKASEAILALKPVTFHYKKELDPDGIPQFGLVAEEVEKVSPDLVVRDDQGKAYTVRYEAVNAMLLNEFLKEHREVQELKKQVAALTAGLQKVSAELELSKRGAQTVLNDR